MKKNVMLKIAAVVMVAVLLSTCAISTTFAKYTSTGTKQVGAAHVAAWGIEIDSAAANMFAKEYGTADTAKVLSATEVIAPGTNGSYAITNVVSGTPEVSGEIKYTLVVKYNNMPTDATEPLTFKAGDSTLTFDENGKAVLGTTQFKANEAVNSANAFTINWEWGFDNDVNDMKLADEDVTVEVSLIVDVYQTGPAGAPKA